MKIGRNDPCPCGSGKKYKKCCLGKKEVSVDLLYRRISEVHDRLVEKLMHYSAREFGEAHFTLALGEFLDWPEEPDAEKILNDHDQLFFPWYLFEWAYDPQMYESAFQGFPRLTVAESYMDQYPGRLDPLQRRLIEAVTGQPYSFYEVVHCDPGNGYRLRDLLRESEPVYVIEHMGSQNVRPGDILFCRVVAVESVAMIIGCGTVLIPPRLKAELIRFRAWLLVMSDPITRDVLLEWGMEVRRVYFNLYNILTTPPKLQNTDGDPLAFHVLHYEIDSPQQAFEALKSLAVLDDEESLRREATLDDRGRILRAVIPWSREASGDSMLSGGTILGHIRIGENRMRVEVNSARRAETIRRKISRRLGRHARYRTTELISIPDAMEDAGEPPEGMAGPWTVDENLMQQPEVRRQINSMIKAHWRGWINRKIPALGDKTPLQAIRTADGREAVEALLLDAERGMQAGEPAMEMEMAAIADVRRRLKLDGKPRARGRGEKSRRAEAVMELIRDFGGTGLDERYIAPALRLCERISRMRKLSIQRGRVEIWAAAIIYTIAKLNFLFDSSNPDYITADQVCNFFNTRKTTVINKASQIRKACDLYPGMKAYCVPEIVETFRFYENEDGFLIPGGMITDGDRPVTDEPVRDQPAESDTGKPEARGDGADDRQLKLFDDC